MLLFWLIMFISNKSSSLTEQSSIGVQLTESTHFHFSLFKSLGKEYVYIKTYFTDTMGSWICPTSIQDMKLQVQYS